MKPLLLLMFLVSGAANAQTVYTMADVAKHATPTDCWMVLNGTSVYDMSAFISKHPGGTTMVPSCGKDGTANFNSGHRHSSSAVAMEPAYLVGTLATPPPPPPTACAYTYSSWSTCTGGKQTRTVTASTPKGCTGTPVLSQACTITPPPSTDAALPHASISDHFARHAQFVKDNGTKLCTTCHGADAKGGSAVAHGTLVSATYPGQAFKGPRACYLAPWGSPAFAHADPMGTEVYPAQVCSDKVKGVAVFAAGTPITCQSCHGYRIPGGHGGRDD